MNCYSLLRSPMKLDDRVAAIASAAADFSWLGDLTSENISHWIELELGQFLNSPGPRPYGNQHCFTSPLSPILHIVSANTPHAALQSLIRGVIVGATNWIKLPREGCRKSLILSAGCRKRYDRNWPPTCDQGGWRKPRRLWSLARTKPSRNIHGGFCRTRDSSPTDTRSASD
jgi:hypothetical protein